MVKVQAGVEDGNLGPLSRAAGSRRLEKPVDLLQVLIVVEPLFSLVDAVSFVSTSFTGFKVE